MESLVLSPHLLHLHLLLLYDRLRLCINLGSVRILDDPSLLPLLSHGRRCLFDLFDLLICHCGISHATPSWLSVLVLGPLLDLIVSTGDELVAEVEQDGLRTLLDNLPSNALQRVALHVHSLYRLMVSKPVR